MAHNICMFADEKEEREKLKNFAKPKKVPTNLKLSKFFGFIVLLIQAFAIDSYQYIYVPRPAATQRLLYSYSPYSGYARSPVYSPSVMYARPAYSHYTSPYYAGYHYQDKYVPAVSYPSVSAPAVPYPAVSAPAQNFHEKSLLQHRDEIIKAIETLKIALLKSDSTRKFAVTKESLLDYLGIAKQFTPKQIELIKSTYPEDLKPTDPDITEEYIRGYKAALVDIVKRVKMSEKLHEAANQIKEPTTSAGVVPLQSVTQLAPSVTQPAPTVTQPASSVTQPTPSVTQPTPSVPAGIPQSQYQGFPQSQYQGFPQSQYQGFPQSQTPPQPFANPWLNQNPFQPSLNPYAGIPDAAQAGLKSSQPSTFQQGLPIQNPIPQAYLPPGYPFQLNPFVQGLFPSGSPSVKENPEFESGETHKNHRHHHGQGHHPGHFFQEKRHPS